MTMAASGDGNAAPLKKPDWTRLKTISNQFQTKNPDIQILEVTYEQRLVTPGMKEAFAIKTVQRDSEIITNLGASSCDRCGTWTCSWCESCDLHMKSPKTPICSHCDKKHLICDSCMSQELLWSPADHASSEYMIINGFYGADEIYTNFREPCKLHLASIPVGPDGVYDVTYIMQKVSEHADRDGQ